MRLIISNLENFTQSDLNSSRFLGIWCFKGRENEFKDWEEVSFIDNPYNNLEELRAGEDIILDTAHIIEKDIADYLNDFHGIEHPIEFWHPIVNPWMITGLMLIYTNYKRLNKLFFDGSWNVTLMESNEPPIIYNVEHFTNLAQKNDHFNYWLISRIIKNYNYNNVKINFSRINCSYHTCKENNSNNLSIKKKIGVLFSNIIDTYGENTKQIILKEIKGISSLDKLKIIAKVKRQKFSEENNFLKRKEIDKNKIDKKYLEISKNILLELLPESFKGKHILGGKKLPALTITGCLQFYDTSYHISLANSMLKKRSKIIGSQHGSAYGTYDVYPIVNKLEYAQCDKFITWGWKEQSNYPINSVPLPSPYLSKHFDKHKRTNDHLILILSGNWYYTDYRLGGLLKSNYAIQQTRRRIKFINALQKEIYDNIYVRGHFVPENQYPQEQVLINNFPEIKFINGPLDPQLMKCKLLVMDHPGTTFHLAMAMNLPGVYYWKPDNFPLSKQAKPYFNSLRESGILFDKEIEASEKINSVWGNIDDWWESDKTQSARNNFCNNYAQCNPNWLKEWVKFINEL